jgi:hypothetical protein
MMDDKRGYEPWVSITDPDARTMKTSDGGFAPSGNMQVVTDAHLVLVADVRVTRSDRNRKLTWYRTGFWRFRRRRVRQTETISCYGNVAIGA